MLNSSESKSAAPGSTKPRVINLTICTGTACYILGGSELLLIEEALPQELQGKVNIIGSPCLGHCRGSEGNRHTPCVVINGKLHTSIALGEVVRLVQEEWHALEQ